MRTSSSSFDYFLFITIRVSSGKLSPKIYENKKKAFWGSDIEIATKVFFIDQRIQWIRKSVLKKERDQ